MQIQHDIVHPKRNIAAIQEQAAPTLIALREPARNFADGVLFAMKDGATRVTCWVSREALDRIGNACQQDPMACFERHRLEIEELASQKYDAGERSPVVLSYDFETSR
jgi:hypothetical protein